MKTSKVYLIAAVDRSFGIGINNELPWHFRSDMEHFKRITTTVDQPEKINAVIMGRKTWESLPDGYQPLPARLNLVLTRQDDYEPEGAKTFKSLDEAIADSKNNEYVEKIFIIGGGEIFAQGLKHSDTAGIFLTQIDNDYDCDTFFEDIPKSFSQETLIAEKLENGIGLRFTFFSKPL